MNESFLLIVYNRLAIDTEIEEGFDPEERMLDSEILSDDTAYNEFLESQDAKDLDVKVTAIHHITSEGYIIGEP